MQKSCRKAVELGLPSIAFTEHADWIRGPDSVFDVESYFDSIERCRAAYPGLRILSGVELGEPHRYPEEARALLAAPFDRVLASVHCVEWNGQTTDACEPGFLTLTDVGSIFRLYLGEVLALLLSQQSFQVLAHLDYPKRYWPAGPEYREAPYEDEFRAVLRAAALRGVALEVNTTRGRDPNRYLCPGPTVLGWWREEGGRTCLIRQRRSQPRRGCSRLWPGTGDGYGSRFQAAGRPCRVLDLLMQTPPSSYRADMKTP